MRRILLVDDDPDFRSVQMRILKREGYEVVAGENGNHAIDALSEQTFDLVITDLIMPEKEGVETISEIVRRWPDVRVMAMSGGGRIDPVGYLDLAKNLGAVDTLIKPFPTIELLEKVNRALSNES